MNRPIIAAIALYFTLTIGVLLIWPKYKELILIKKIIEKQNTEIQNTINYFDKLRKIDNDLAAKPEIIAKIDSALPSESIPTDLFNFFQSVSSDNGLILKEVTLGSTLRPSASGILSKTKVTDFTITLVGTYPAFKNFISETEKSARLIDIKNISFSSASLASKKTSAISFTLTVETHAFSE